MDFSLFPLTPVLLERNSLDQSWGFRLQGGTDFRLPLSVKKVQSTVILFPTRQQGHHFLLSSV